MWCGVFVFPPTFRLGNWAQLRSRGHQDGAWRHGEPCAATHSRIESARARQRPIGRSKLFVRALVRPQLPLRAPCKGVRMARRAAADRPTPTLGLRSCCAATTHRHRDEASRTAHRDGTDGVTEGRAGGLGCQLVGCPGDQPMWPRKVSGMGVDMGFTEDISDVQSYGESALRWS